MKLAEATELALQVAAWLEPACERVVVAGSIRRERAEVKDIELVGLPLFGNDIFGSVDYSRPLCLNERLKQLVAEKKLAWDPALKRDGDRYKRLVVPDAGGAGAGMAVDLFLACHDNWGNILAMRTGNAAFSEALFGAAKRQGLRNQDGRLYRVKTGQIVPCGTEARYFEAVGVAYLPPRERDDAAAWRIVRGQQTRRASTWRY